MKDKFLKVVIPAAFWLMVWTVAAQAVGRELLLPSPLAVARTLLELAPRGDFWLAVFHSLLRVLGGFLLGCVFGVALGIVTAAWSWCDRLFSPALRAVRTVPVVSFILLLFFWLPKGQVPTAVSALMALPVVWRSTRQGAAAADVRLLELAEHYRLGSWRKLTLVRLPAALPALCAGWETALGLAWKSGVAAEVLCQPQWAMGSQLQSAKAYLEAPALFAWTAVIVALSLVSEGLLKWALKVWKGDEA